MRRLARRDGALWCRLPAWRDARRAAVRLRRPVVRFWLWRSGVWGPWERLRTPMPVPHRVRVQATVCGSGQSSCDSNVFESVFRMKWLRRAIPSAANLGPDTDSSFRARETPFFLRGCTFRLFGAAFTRCRFVGLGMWSLLTRCRFIIPALCGRPFPSDCGVEGEAGGIASRTGRRLRSVLPYIPGVVLRGGYEKSVRKSRPREVVGMERGGKGDGRGMKAQNSAAARLC